MALLHFPLRGKSYLTEDKQDVQPQKLDRLRGSAKEHRYDGKPE